MDKWNRSQPARLGGSDTVVWYNRGGPKSGRGIAWTGRPETYYAQPLIKKSPWKWQIVLYFFFGGIAGGAYLVTTLAHFLGLGKKNPALIRVGRYTSFFSLLVSPVLLIWDLGRPERFHHMLRVLKFRSPMSIGTWVLSAFGICCGLTSVHQMAEDGFLNWLSPISRIFKALPVKTLETIGSFFGILLASYTGVLLAATAVPLWARARYILGPLFLSSGLSTALASISLILSLGKPEEDALDRLDRAEIATMVTELALLSSLPSTLGPLGKPLIKGKRGALFTCGTVIGGVLLPLLGRLGFRISRNVPSRTVNIVSSLFVLIGGLIMRYVWVYAGHDSAQDPEATHEYNRVEWEELTNKQ
ncbi:polysulfide reductase [Dictyobacter alpinus]|uniref:Polysulfide reductase n=1 Tax=Dictyobacter alpinus TaxID=2014873 RepID=A0A402BFP1_9CHLR|nr:NrfD/PsrC family molybdoenzyme membrane anchor subunit [Dictyobacter alpinus]GCE30218.1 polysulfide reductase [Dictyobacter alpinus]